MPGPGAVLRKHRGERITECTSSYRTRTSQESGRCGRKKWEDCSHHAQRFPCCFIYVSSWISQPLMLFNSFFQTRKWGSKRLCHAARGGEGLTPSCLWLLTPAPPPPLQLSLPSPAGTCISGTYKSARSSRHHCLQGIKQGRSWRVGGSPVRNRAWRATNPRVMGPSSSPFWLKRLKEFSSNPRNYPFPFSGDVAIKETWQREAVGLERSVVRKSPESSTINALIVIITHFSLKRQTSSFPFSSPRSQMFNIPN